MIEPLEFVINPLAFEEWKLVDLEGVVKNYYYASNCGRVKNIKGQILKAYPNNSGYLVYWLYNGNKYPPKYKLFSAHRLVMLVFNPISNARDMEVNHKNCDKYFNYDGNLEWTTASGNMVHSVCHKAESEIYDRRAKLNKNQVYIIMDGILHDISYKEIIERIGIEDNIINRGIITNIKRGKAYTSFVNLFWREQNKNRNE